MHWAFFQVRSFHRDELGCFQAAVILLFQHVDFKVVVPLKETELVLEATHGLLGVHVFLGSLLVELVLQLFVLFL